jgi:hypothetical protein
VASKSLAVLFEPPTQPTKDDVLYGVRVFWQFRIAAHPSGILAEAIRKRGLFHQGSFAYPREIVQSGKNTGRFDDVRLRGEETENPTEQRQSQES